MPGGSWVSDLAFLLSWVTLTPHQSERDERAIKPTQRLRLYENIYPDVSGIPGVPLTSTSDEPTRLGAHLYAKAYNMSPVSNYLST